MKVVIIGAGEVGYNLAIRFAKEDHDLTVIDNNPEKCKFVKTTVDAQVIEGDGASQRILQQINMPEVDIFLALTRIDEINLVASRIAKKMGANQVIARLRNTEYSHKKAVISPDQFGIDYVTYPEKAAQREIDMLVRRSATAEIQEFAKGKITLAGIKLESSSPLIGRTVQNVELSNPFIRHKLVIVIRKDHPFIPHEDTKYHRDDTVYFVGDTNDIESIQQMAGIPAIELNKLMILGAGKIGRLLAKSLQTDFDVRLVEKDRDKAEKAGANLSNTLILNESGTNIEFLESEHISEVDCFIAVTDNEQTNILSSLLVKHMGVKQVITHITTTSFIPAVRRFGLDAIVSKNIAAVNDVINYIRSDSNISISRFEDIDIEAVELTVQPDCKFLRKKWPIEKIPQEMSLGAIIRDGNVEIPNHYSIIKPYDDLLIFTKPSFVSTAENLFNQ